MSSKQQKGDTVVECDSETGLDPRVKRTRRLLVEALNSLMKEKSIPSITVADLASRAGVNRATFYAHFPDKFALLEHSVRERFREVLSGQIPCPTQFRLAHLRGLCLAVAEFFASFGGQCRKSDREFDPLIEATVQGSLQQFALRWLEYDTEGIRRGNPVVQAGVLSWAIFGTALQWSRAPRVLTADELADQLEARLVEGLKGRAGEVPGAVGAGHPSGARSRRG